MRTKTLPVYHVLNLHNLMTCDNVYVVCDSIEEAQELAELFKSVIHDDNETMRFWDETEKRGVSVIDDYVDEVIIADIDPTTKVIINSDGQAFIVDAFFVTVKERY